MNIKSISEKINEKQNMIIEMLVISCISGWFITNIINGTFDKLESIAYIAELNIVSFMSVVVLDAVIVAIIYSMNRRLARIIMFLSIFIYSLLSIYNNPLSIYYAIGLIIISALAMLYVVKDIVYYARKVNFNEKTGLILAITAGLLLTVFISVITVLRYKTYSNSTFDFGIFAQMFENMKNTGHPYTSVERPEQGLFSHFGVHFSPIYYIMLPVYFIFSSPVTVQVIQAVVLGAAVVPLYYLCRHYKLSEKFSVLMCVLYCIFPATAAGTYYDFHENCCIPLLILSLILMLEKKKDVWAIVFAVLMLMVKEESSFYLLLLGVYFFVSKRDKKRGIIMSIGAVIYFFIATAIIRSYGIGSVGDLSAMRYQNVYYKSGGMSQIIVTLLANPAYVLKEIMSEEKIKYIVLMVLPMGLALVQKKKYSRYLLLGTMIVLNLIPAYQYMYDIGFQYSFGAVSLIMYIAVMTVSEWKKTRRNKWAVTSFVMTAILFAGFTCPKFETYVERYKQNEKTYEAMDEAISVVPEGANVLTSGFVMPHLYYINDLTVISEGMQVTQDYVVIDLRAGYSTDYDFIGTQLEQNYTIVSQVQGSLAVYKKN